MNKEQALEYLHGRLVGLAGTARYELPEELRTELKDIAKIIHTQIAPNHDITHF